jgi:alpha-L-fucosidase
MTRIFFATFSPVFALALVTGCSSGSGGSAQTGVGSGGASGQSQGTGGHIVAGSGGSGTGGQTSAGTGGSASGGVVGVGGSGVGAGGAGTGGASTGGMVATGGRSGTGGLATGGTGSGGLGTGGANTGGVGSGGRSVTGGASMGGSAMGGSGAGGSGTGGSGAGGSGSGGSTVPGQKTTYQNQQAFVDLRYGMFIHFNMGTFHDMEWVTPNLDPLTFAPTDVNTDQWAATAKAAGMKFAVLTTKHHDGFALWPTKLSKYNVMNSSYKVDIVKKYVDSFRAAGVIPCLYFSIWDRTQGIAAGSVSKADLDYITGQLTELLGGTYGEIPLIMFDGWTWQMGHNAVPYQLIRETVKSLQPNILMVDHNGLTQPFEEDLLNFEHFQVPGTNNYASTQGNPIMPKWFWHPGYDTLDPLPLNSILSRLSATESHWCNFLLDCPPNPNGVLDKNVVDRLTAAGAQWKPNASRAPLPAQPIQLEHPVSPVAVTATSGTAANAIDGMNDYVSGQTVQSLWQSAATLPQSVTLDFGAVYSNIDYLGYMPRQDHVTDGTVTSAYVTTGDITSYNIYASSDGTTFTKVTSGTWAVDGTIKRVQFPATTARYLRLEATAASGASYAVISEIDAGGVANKPVVQ